MFNDILAYLQFQLASMDLSFSWTNVLEILVIVGILFVFYKKSGMARLGKQIKAELRR